MGEKIKEGVQLFQSKLKRRYSEPIVLYCMVVVHTVCQLLS